MLVSTVRISECNILTHQTCISAFPLHLIIPLSCNFPVNYQIKIKSQSSAHRHTHTPFLIIKEREYLLIVFTCMWVQAFLILNKLLIKSWIECLLSPASACSRCLPVHVLLQHTASYAIHRAAGIVLPSSLLWKGSSLTPRWQSPPMKNRTAKGKYSEQTK